MKANYIHKDELSRELYIPHGSDERIKYLWVLEFQQRFISHMVQMKGRSCTLGRCCSNHLYIPHGSDESFCYSMLNHLKKDFISHMVQMKAVPIALGKLSTRFFISHMVQMKVLLLCLFLAHLLPLYPTWFRWKVKSHLNAFLQYLLYIPHGSDESYNLSRTIRLFRRLYIPHGSDERLKSESQCNWFSRLYIPHGSDESFYAIC